MNKSTRLILSGIELIFGLLALLIFFAAVKHGVSSMNILLVVAVAILGLVLGIKELVIAYRRR